MNMLPFIKEKIEHIVESKGYRITWKRDESFEVDHWRALDGKTLHWIASLPIEVTIGHFDDEDCGKMFFYQINK